MKTTILLTITSTACLFMTACDSDTTSSTTENGVSGTTDLAAEDNDGRFSFNRTGTGDTAAGGSSTAIAFGGSSGDVAGNLGGPDGEDISIDQSARAQTLSFMVAGDSTVWETIQGFGTAPFETQRLNPENTAEDQSTYDPAGGGISSDKSGLIAGDDVVYTYVKNGTHTYQLVCNLPGTTKDEVEQSIGDLFGLAAGVDDVFRQLLLKPGEPTPSFTRVELQNMVDSIIAAGTTQERWLIVDPDEDQIIILDDSQIIIENTSTSTNRDILANAEMSGSFSADLNGVHRRIVFRRPSILEINTFNSGVRGLTTGHWLPVVEEMPAKDFINIQSGNYTDNLVNTPVGGIR